MKRRLLVLVAAALCVLGLAGCSTIGTLVHTDDALRNAGYQAVSVSPKPDTDSLSVQVTVAAAPSAVNVRGVAGIVWASFHQRFADLSITVHGTGPEVQRDITFAQMQEAFGPRNPAWNSTSVRSGLLRTGTAVIVAVVVLVGLVVAVVLLARRRGPGRRGGRLRVGAVARLRVGAVARLPAIPARPRRTRRTHLPAHHRGGAGPPGG